MVLGSALPELTGLAKAEYVLFSGCNVVEGLVRGSNQAEIGDEAGDCAGKLGSLAPILFSLDQNLWDQLGARVLAIFAQQHVSCRV